MRTLQRELFESSTPNGQLATMVRPPIFDGTGLYAEDVYARRIVPHSHPRHIIDPNEAYMTIMNALMVGLNRFLPKDGTIKVLASGGMQSLLIVEALRKMGRDMSLVTFSHELEAVEELDIVSTVASRWGIAHSVELFTDKDIVDSASVSAAITSMDTIINMGSFHDMSAWNLISRSLNGNTVYVAGGFLYDIIGSDLAHNARTNADIDNILKNKKGVSRTRMADCLCHVELPRRTSIFFPFATRGVFDAGASFDISIIRRMTPQNSLLLRNIYSTEANIDIRDVPRYTIGQSLTYPESIIRDAYTETGIKHDGGNTDDVIQSLHILRKRDEILRGAR